VEGLETGRAQRREEAETDAHEQQAADGKKEEPQVETWMEIRPTPPSCELRDDPAHPGEGGQRARRSECRDEYAFADELTHQHAASCPERKTGRHLLAALQCPRQEKTGHICAGDQEEQHSGYSREFEEAENPLLGDRAQ